MVKILNDGEREQVEDVVLTALEEGGFSPEEAIPGLMAAVKQLALETENPDQALNEAVKELE